jgi:hypothetical protein
MLSLKSYLFAVVYSIIPQFCVAQFTSGNSFFITGGSTISIDGLALVPGANTLLVNKSITLSNEAITGKPNNSIKRVYSCNEDLNFTGKLTVFYLPDELNGNSEVDLQVAYQSNDEDYTTKNGCSVDIGKHCVSTYFNNQDFLSVTAIAVNTVLPVTLTEFKVVSEKEHALLNWSTSSEINSQYFDVEHSINGRNWTSLGKVTASLHSSNERNYQFTHQEFVSGINYYRLKLVDQDETFTYSRIVTLHSEDESIAYFPNPVLDRLFIKANKLQSIEKIELINNTGKVVYAYANRHHRENFISEIDLQKFPSGIYIIRLTGKDKCIRTHSVIKL